MKHFLLIKLTILVLLTIFVSNLAAQDSASVKFEEANRLFKDKKYSSALKIYEELAKEGYKGEELYFNLGYTYSKTGETGKSILNLERALLFSKNNSRVNALLVNEHLKIKDKIVRLPDFFIFKFFKDVAALLNIWLWLFIALVAYIILLFFIAGFVLKRDYAGKRNLSLFLPPILLVLLFSVSSLFISYEMASNVNECVVISENVHLYSVPEQGGNKEGLISEGNKLEILEVLTDWYRVKLPNGKEGWILKTGVEEV